MTAPILTREQKRSRRIRVVRAATINTRRLPRYVVEEGRAAYPETGYWRPSTRGECAGGARPCPFVACRYHLYLDVDQNTGSIKLNFPDLEPGDLGESCALDVADRGGLKLEDVGARVNITRERVRQIELVAVVRLQALRAQLVADGVLERHHHGER